MTLRSRKLYRSIAGAATRFRASLSRASAVQQRALQTLLARNAPSEYGRRYAFAALRGEAAFRTRVPVVGYEELAPQIERIAAAERNVLTSEPVLCFEETGGSTSGRKLVPYTASLLQSFRAALLPWLDDLVEAWPQIDAGRAYWAISPAARAPRRTPGGIPIGLPGDAAYFGEDLAPAVVETLAVPPEVGELGDFERWREATVRALLDCEDLALVSVWSPTFFSQLLRHMEAAGRRDFAQLWPRLAVVSCWDQAASRPFAQALASALPQAQIQGKGLLSTEGVVSIPLCGERWPVLAVDSGYYEFRDDEGNCVSACAASTNTQYEIILTTAGGLYRYATGDRVRVHGFIGEAPTLEFLGRGALAVDLCGEKLDEQFVISALSPLGLAFALVAPGPKPRPGYLLFVDAEEVDPRNAANIAFLADQALAANPQYAHARAHGQLDALAVRRCRAPLEAWLANGLERGQRLGDIKPPALSGDASFLQSEQ